MTILCHRDPVLCPKMSQDFSCTNGIQLTPPSPPPPKKKKTFMKNSDGKCTRGQMFKIRFNKLKKSERQYIRH